MNILDKYQKLYDDVVAKYEGPTPSHIPNLPIYAHYFNERELMRIRREDQGLPAPWTSDPILGGFRFTNIQRDDDKVTRQLINATKDKGSDDLVMFNALVFRTFNSLIGYDSCGGWWDKWDEAKALEMTDMAYTHGTSLFGNAYLMTNSMTKGHPKHRFYVRLFSEVWEQRHDIVMHMQDHPTLEETVTLFSDFSGYGEFLAYELALDMEAVELLDPDDKFTWANPGPGARRGLNFLYGRPPNKTQPTIKFLGEMRELWDLSMHFLQPHVKEPFDMRCIENGLCETSKYGSVLVKDRAKRRYP